MNSTHDQRARFILAAAITFGFFAVVFVVLFVTVPETVRDIVLVLLGALIASFKEVTGYFFGTSAGSTAKDAVIAATTTGAPLLGAPTGRPEDPVAVTEVEPPEGAR